ncbi:MAG: hypothetical protein FK734_13065 [Asgard group archaeon]|nr:hypothetical protein [Asgard group archaeon]
MNAALFVGVILLLSVPWGFISPYQYVRHMLFPGRPIEIRFTPITPAHNDCVSFAISLQQLGLEGLLLAFTSFGNYSMFFMILSASLISVPMFIRSYKGKMDGIEFFEWIAPYTIFTHIFMPRGVYKFYTAYYVPMIIVALIGSITHFTQDNKTLPISMTVSTTLVLGFNVGLFIIGRWSVPVYLFWIAISIGLIGIIRGYARGQANKKKLNPLWKSHLEYNIG